MGQIVAIDFAILDWIQAHLRTGFLDGFFSAVTHLGDSGILWIALAVVLLAIKRTRPLGVCMALALLTDLLLCNLLIKPLVARVRPYDLRPAIELLIKPPGDYSFPSGHTAASFAAITCLWRCRSKLWPWALALGVIIAVSRLYLYVHYPTDVLAGFVIGVAAGLAGTALGRLLFRIFERRRT